MSYREVWKCKLSKEAFDKATDEQIENLVEDFEAIQQTWEEEIIGEEK